MNKWISGKKSFNKKYINNVSTEMTERQMKKITERQMTNEYLTGENNWIIDYFSVLREWT